jgi:hypothetical protein
MSTNAVIRVEGLDVELYKHWDGYPDATLEWLEKFHKDFNDRRGVDPQYEFAQLVRSSIRDADEFGLDESHYTGWGVSVKGGSYYDYLYILKNDGSVEVVED